MSDNSLDSIISDAVSEPVQDTKESTAEVETKEVEASEEVETEVEETNAVEDKKLTKYEQEVELHGKTKAGMQKRIDRVTAQRKQEAERITALETQIQELTPKNVDDSPKQEDFDNYDDWEQASIDHKVKKQVEAKELEAKENQLAEQKKVTHEKAEKAFQEKEHAFRSDNPDYEANAKNFDELANMVMMEKGATDPTLSAINGLLLDSDFAPHLINEMGSNPDLVDNLANMSPFGAVRELIKLEGTLGSAKQADPLPKPISKVKGSGKPSKGLDAMGATDLSDWVNS